MTPLLVFLLVPFSPAFVKPGKTGDAEVKNLIVASDDAVHQSQESVRRSPKALGSQKLEQEAEGTGWGKRWRGAQSWQTGLWEMLNPCRKEMLNPCVCSGQ